MAVDGQAAQAEQVEVESCTCDQQSLLDHSSRTHQADQCPQRTSVCPSCSVATWLKTLQNLRGCQHSEVSLAVRWVGTVSEDLVLPLASAGRAFGRLKHWRWQTHGRRKARVRCYPPTVEAARSAADQRSRDCRWLPSNLWSRSSDDRWREETVYVQCGLVGHRVARRVQPLTRAPDWNQTCHCGSHQQLLHSSMPFSANKQRLQHYQYCTVK